jgi:hypothetical protein
MLQTGSHEKDDDLLGREFYFTPGYFSWWEPDTFSLSSIEDDCVSLYDDIKHEVCYMNHLEDILTRIEAIRFI